MDTELHHLPDYDSIYDRIKHMLVGPTADMVSPLADTINNIYNNKTYIAVCGDLKLHNSLETVTALYEIAVAYYEWSLEFYHRLTEIINS